MASLTTNQALELTGIDRGRWNDAISRGNYLEAPDVAPGVARYFDRDDILALTIFDHWTRLGGGLKPAAAARVASAVRAELRKHGDEIEHLYVVATPHGTPRRVVATDPGEDLIRHEIPVRALRRKIEQLVRERLEARP